jgi:hypothetical protein
MPLLMYTRIYTSTFFHHHHLSLYLYDCTIYFTNKIIHSELPCSAKERNRKKMLMKLSDGMCLVHVYTKPLRIQTKIKPRIIFFEKSSSSRKEVRETVYMYCVYSSFFLTVHADVVVLWDNDNDVDDEKEHKKVYFLREDCGEKFFFCSFFLSCVESVRGKRQKHRKILFRYQLYKT